MRHIVIFSVVLLNCVLLVASPIQKVVLLINKPEQYKKTEWQIKIDIPFKNPYDQDEIALDMILKSPSGRTSIVPCYYESVGSDSISCWKARFCASEAGKYVYSFVLNKGGVVIDSTASRVISFEPSSKKGFLHPNNFWTLRYDNGDLFRGIGLNIGWESRDEDDSKYFKALHEDKRYNYAYMVKKLAQNGGNFFRTWMIYWNLPVDWPTVYNNSRYKNSSGYFNESGAERLDWLVEYCDSLGVYIMLTLDSHVGYMGMGWEISKYNIKNGGFAHTPKEFFTHPQSKKQYKNKLRYMVARYGYSPAIAAWEFFNEIDHVVYEKADDKIQDSIITNWHDEMSQFLRKTDPYQHIITTSISHRDIEGLNQVKNIDINQRHIYKNTKAIPSVIIDYTQKFSKPYVIGESAYEWDWSKNFNDFAEEMDNDFKQGLWLGMFSPTPILPMSWWWEFFEHRGLMEYFSKVQIVNQLIINDCNGNIISTDIKVNPASIDIRAIRTKSKIFVYLYCNTDAVNPRLSGEALKNVRKILLFSPDVPGINGSTAISYSTEKNAVVLKNVQLKARNNYILMLE